MLDPDQKRYVSKAPQTQRVMGALSDIQKGLKLTLTSLGIYFALPSSKKKCFKVRFAMYTDCSKKKTDFVIL